MPRKTVFRGEVSFLQILDEEDHLDRALVPALAKADLLRLYETMVEMRLFDERAFLLQREGRLGTYAPSTGQEAAQVGSAFALAPRDWVVPSYRENGVLLARGISMQNVLLYWSGDERGMQISPEMRVLPYCIPVGTQIPHSVGIAYAEKLRGEGGAVICYFGDGATSTGDFHEGLTLAGTMKVPVVFFCQNNQWAISVPRSRQCAAATLAQKALGYGIEGAQVDGNDVLACYAATSEALARARRGEGATLVEAVTYRIGDHTTADDASRYRDVAEVEAWKRRDPLLRFRRYLEREGLWNEALEQAHRENCARRIDEAVKSVESISPPDPEDIVRYTFAPSLPPQRSPAPTDAASQAHAEQGTARH